VAHNAGKCADQFPSRNLAAATNRAVQEGSLGQANFLINACLPGWKHVKEEEKRMKAGRLIRIGVDVWPGFVERYCPDVRTTSFDSQTLTRSERRELRKAIDSALASLDELFGQVR